MVETAVVPGSLPCSGSDEEKEEEELESLLFSTEKEFLNLMHKNLVKASSKKKAYSGKKFETGSTLETGMKDYTVYFDALLSAEQPEHCNQGPVCLAQERNTSGARGCRHLLDSLLDSLLE